jgi:hypothetical protein
VTLEIRLRLLNVAQSTRASDAHDRFPADCRRRLDALRGRHARKVTLINRLRKAGL